MKCVSRLFVPRLRLSHQLNFDWELLNCVRDRVVVVYLHENNQFSMNIMEKIYNIIYHIQFQTYTMQTRP